MILPKLLEKETEEVEEEAAKLEFEEDPACPLLFVFPPPFNKCILTWAPLLALFDMAGIIEWGNFFHNIP